MVGRQQTGAKSVLINRFTRPHLLTNLGDVSISRSCSPVTARNWHIKTITDIFIHISLTTITTLGARFYARCHIKTPAWNHAQRSLVHGEVASMKFGSLVWHVPERTDCVNSISLPVAVLTLLGAAALSVEGLSSSRTILASRLAGICTPSFQISLPCFKTLQESCGLDGDARAPRLLNIDPSDRMSRWEIQLTQRLPWLTNLSKLTDRPPCPCQPSSPPLSRRSSPGWLCRTSPPCPSLCQGAATRGCTQLSGARSITRRGPRRACSRRKGRRMSRKSRWTRRICGVNFTKGELRWLLRNQEGTWTNESERRVSSVLCSAAEKKNNTNAWVIFEC